MAFTGEVYYGWRVASHIEGRRTRDGTGRWVDEVVIELVKDDRNIHATGQDGIDPEIVLLRALGYGLRDDLREATERGDIDIAMQIEATLAAHDARTEVKLNGYVTQRALVRIAKAAALKASTIQAGARDGSHQ